MTTFLPASWCLYVALCLLLNFIRDICFYATKPLTVLIWIGAIFNLHSVVSQAMEVPEKQSWIPSRGGIGLQATCSLLLSTEQHCCYVLGLQRIFLFRNRCYHIENSLKTTFWVMVFQMAFVLAHAHTHTIRNISNQNDLKCGSALQNNEQRKHFSYLDFIMVVLYIKYDFYFSSLQFSEPLAQS